LPKGCGGNDENVIVIGENGGISGNALIAVVVLLVLVNLVLIILYRRCSNKELKNDLQI
jgi:hypothetical protein